MNKIINGIKNTRIFILTLLLTLLNEVKASAVGAGDPMELEDMLDNVKPSIEDFIKPVSAVLVFIGVIFIGINIIIKRNKPEERANSMWALVTIGIGSFILGSVGLIYEFIMSLYV